MLFDTLNEFWNPFFIKTTFFIKFMLFQGLNDFSHNSFIKTTLFINFIDIEPLNDFPFLWRTPVYWEKFWPLQLLTVSWPSKIRYQREDENKAHSPGLCSISKANLYLYTQICSNERWAIAFSIKINDFWIKCDFRFESDDWPRIKQSNWIRFKGANQHIWVAVIINIHTSAKSCPKSLKWMWQVSCWYSLQIKAHVNRL